MKRIALMLILLWPALAAAQVAEGENVDLHGDLQSRPCNR